MLSKVLKGGSESDGKCGVGWVVKKKDKKEGQPYGEVIYGR